MQVKVIFPKLNEEWKMNASGDHVREFIWTAPGETDAAALEQTFREFNVVLEDDSHIARECRSMSVGDIAICIDSLGQRIYICDTCGWKLVSKLVADFWMTCPFSKRLMGPNFIEGKKEGAVIINSKEVKGAKKHGTS